MRKLVLPLAFCLCASGMTPLWAQNDFGNIISGVAQSLIQQEQDKAAFAQAQRTNTIAAYRDYLSRYPNGAYVDQAGQALRHLGSTVAPQPQPLPDRDGYGNAASREAALGLSRTQRGQVQRKLTALGYNTRGVDGVWGRNTRLAIATWQDDRGDASTGYLTREQWQVLQTRNGISEPEARPTVPDTTMPEFGAGDQATENRIGLSASERREVQLRLTLLGYDTRGTDGSFGNNTRRALQRWQADQGLKATGYLTGAQWRALQSQSRQ